MHTASAKIAAIIQKQTFSDACGSGAAAQVRNLALASLHPSATVSSRRKGRTSEIAKEFLPASTRRPDTAVRIPTLRRAAEDMLSKLSPSVFNTTQSRRARSGTLSNQSVTTYLLKTAASACCLIPDSRMIARFTPPYSVDVFHVCFGFQLKGFGCKNPLESGASCHDAVASGP